MASRIGFSFSDNLGARLENAVYVELRRREEDVYYYHDKKECDFVVKKSANIVSAIQVTVSLADAETRQRELEGLVATMDAFGLKEGTVVTLDEAEELMLDDGRSIHVTPYYRWIIESSLN